MVLRKQTNIKSQRITLSRHSQLLLHVVLIHAFVMYVCSWYVEHTRAKTAIWILTTNRTIHSTIHSTSPITAHEVRQLQGRASLT